MLPIPKRTQIIGNFSKVKNDYNRKFKPGSDAEIMFLYLKTLQHQRQLKLDQEDNIIDVISRRADYTKKYNNYINEDDEDQKDRINRQRDLDKNKQRYESDKLFAKKESRGSRLSQQVSQKVSQKLQAAAAATDQKQTKFKLDSGEQIDIAKQSDLLAIYEKEKTNRARQQAAKFKLDSGEEIDEADQRARLAMYKHIAQRQSTTRDRFQEAAKTKQERREQERREQEISDEQLAREQERREQERREQEISDEQLARELVTEIEEEKKAREREKTKKADTKSKQTQERDRQAIRDRQLAQQIQRKEEQLAKDEQYAKQLQQEYYNQYGRGIRIINDKCNTTIKNINNSNCNQKIQKIQNVRDELIEDMNRFFNKKINKLRI